MYTLRGRIQDFKLGGVHIKKIAASYTWHIVESVVKHQ
jgi:hypothetical protein